MDDEGFTIGEALKAMLAAAEAKGYRRGLVDAVRLAEETRDSLSAEDESFAAAQINMLAACLRHMAGE